MCPILGPLGGHSALNWARAALPQSLKKIGGLEGGFHRVQKGHESDVGMEEMDEFSPPYGRIWPILATALPPRKGPRVSRATLLKRYIG